MNYVFLQKSMALVNHNCVLFPRELEFHAVEFSEAQSLQDLLEHELNKNITDDAQSEGNGDDEKVKREAKNNGTMNTNDFTEDDNSTINNGNDTHRLALDTSRTLFETNSDCFFAEYMPLLSTVFAAVWMTMFTMCPSGGRVRTGLTRPWRILAPALIFAFVMVGLTGHNFTLTNGGLHAFCEAFFEVTNTTTCSAVDPYIELSWNASWSMSARTSATRAASAGVWASWSCAAALLLARCLAAPDFVVKRTAVYLSQDPHEKITPYLKKSQRTPRSLQSSPNKEDNVSVRSEPTVVTELVSASVEQGDSAPTSLLVTPVKMSTPQNSENIEMAYTSQERNAGQR